MKVSSIDKDIKSILESGFYQIPRFQRPYSWEKDNVVEFWTDITNKADDEYFIGSMVVFKKKQSLFGIVDGQQRLTSLTLILSAIRDHLNELDNEELAKGIQRLIMKKDLDNNDQFILQTETSYPYFHQCIQSFENNEEMNSVTDEEKALKDAFELFKSLIGRELTNFESDEEKINYLKELRDQVVRLKVIFIELDNEDDAYIIFETLNTRGKDLQPSDLVKNHITKLLRSETGILDRVRDKWKEMLGNIQTSKIDIDINTFIYHYWLSKETYTTQKKLFKEFKNSVNLANVSEHLEAMLVESKYYRAIYEPTYMDWTNEEESLKRSLEALSVFKVKQPLPIVLAILAEYFSKNLKLRNAKKYIEYIEKFHFMHNAVTSQRSSGGLSSYYAKKARELRHAPDEQKKVEVLNNIKNKLSADKPKYEEFELSFLDLKYSDQFTKDKKIVQYILRKFDETLRGGTPLDYGQMTIEHIGSQSDAELPIKDKANIGNLVFVTAKDNNEELKNKSFIEKKQVFASKYSHFEKSILEANEWSKEKILERSKYLSKNAYDKIWSI
jgi:uncharacterized protein with ParB-like and HNH nuclease domain